MKKGLILLMALIMLLSLAGCAKEDDSVQYGPLPGMKAIDFKLRDIATSEEKHLSDFEGKSVLLVFWTSS